MGRWTGSGQGRWTPLLAVLLLMVLGAGIAHTPRGAPVLAATVDFPLEGLIALVAGDVCNLRAGPGTSHRVTGRVTRGDRLTVLGARAGWVNVQHDGGQAAWITGWLVEIDLTPRRAVAVVERANVNMRSGPGLDHPVVGRTDRGNRYPARLLRGEWVQVVAGEGTAWIWLPLVSLHAGPPTGAPSTGAPPVGGPTAGAPGTGAPPGAGVAPGAEPAGGPAGSAVPVPGGSPGLSPGFPAGMLVYPVGTKTIVRRTAVPDAEPVGTITVGNPGRYLGTREGWVRLETGDGTRGWVPGREVRMEWPQDRRIYFRVGPALWEMGSYRTATVTARNVNFRAGPGLGYRVLTRLGRGDTLRVVGTSGAWIQGVSPGGTVGWVAAWLTGGVRAPRDAFRISVEGDEKSRLLSISGGFSSATVLPLEGGNCLAVRTSSPLAARGALGVGTYEFDYISVAGSEVRVFLREQASYRVLGNERGRLVLEFRPVVSAVSLEAGENGEALTIRTVGYARPQATRNGERVEVFLPGAGPDPALAAPGAGGAAGGVQGDGVGGAAGGGPGSGTGSVPGAVPRPGLVTGLDLRTGPEGVTLTATTLPGVTFRVEKGANAIRVRFSPPGLRGKTVVIDPGHGGEDTGARGPTGLLEKHVNWEICWRLAQSLQSRGAKVILTRYGDSPAQPPADWTGEGDDYEGELSWRAAWSRGADLFVSVHNDYYPARSAQGTTTYVTPGTLNGAESRRLAGLVQEEVVGALGTLSRGVQEAEYYVTRKARCPAVLVELMYVSNPREESFLREEATQWRAAHAILRALERYYGAPTAQAQPQPEGPPAPRP